MPEIFWLGWGAMATEIKTYAELQERLEEVARVLTSDFRLAVAAAANPLRALQEAGYELAPRVATIVEERARHPRRRREHLREARKQFESAVGRHVDPSSTEDLMRVLNEELGLDLPAEALAPLPFRRRRPGDPDQPQDDPLAAFSEAHPAVPPLLTYRALEASAPPLADERLYRRLRDGEVDPPLTELRVRRTGSDEVLASARRA